jgi:hypothetical protein
MICFSLWLLYPLNKYLPLENPQKQFGHGEEEIPALAGIEPWSSCRNQ